MTFLPRNLPVMQGNIIDDEAVQQQAGIGCYDIAVANILAPVIIMLQGEIGKTFKTRRSIHYFRYYQYQGAGSERGACV